MVTSEQAPGRWAECVRSGGLILDLWNPEGGDGGGILAVAARRRRAPISANDGSSEGRRIGREIGGPVSRGLIRRIAAQYKDQFTSA